MQNNQEEIDLRAYLGVLAKRWRLIVLTLVIALGVAGWITVTTKKIYSAQVSLLIKTDAGLSDSGGLGNLMRRNLMGGGVGADLNYLLKSKVVAERVLTDLRLTERIKGWDNPKIKRSSLVNAVSGMVKTTKTSGDSGNMFQIRVEANKPQLAADIANAYVGALSYYWNELNMTQAQRKLRYIEKELPRVAGELGQAEEQLKIVPRTGSERFGAGSVGVLREQEIYNAVYVLLRKDYEATKLEAAKDLPPFTVIDLAEVPSRPIQPKKETNLTIGAIIGLLLGVFLAFFSEYWEVSGRKA